MAMAVSHSGHRKVSAADEQPDDHDRGRRRVEHQPQRRWSEPQRPVAPGPEEQVGGERDEERHQAEHPQRHPPCLAAEAE
jgi:hypothetical protein